MSQVARKRFGQNFLTDPAALSAIIAAIAPQNHENLLEIGAGYGALSLPLAARGAQVLALEIDRDLLSWWRRQQTPANLEIQEADALSFDFGNYLSTKTSNAAIRLCGNLPYNISTPIIQKLLPLSPHWLDAHFVVQKEFALRLCAKAGASDYSRLSLLRAFYAQAELLLEIAPEAFDPAPKVHSALVRLRPTEAYRRQYQHLLGAIERLSSIAFNARRKKISVSLADFFSANDWQQLEIDKSLRPQQLSLDDFIKMAQLSRSLL